MDAATIRSFRKAIREFEKLTSRQTKTCCAGVTLAQCHALLEVGARGETTTQQLARVLRLEKNTVSWTIDGLVKLGLVRRSPHSSDRRMVVLTLTREGQARCDAINDANDEYYSRVFEKIPGELHHAVIEKFTLLVRALGNHASQLGKDAACCEATGSRGPNRGERSASQDG